MDIQNTFYIKSQFLKLVEPLIQKYYDYDSSMLEDDIQSCIEKSEINYMTVENGILKINYRKAFNENESLFFINTDYSHKNGIEKASTYKDVADQFPSYFDFDIEDEEISKEHYLVYISLSYMGYIYFKQKNGSFNDPLHNNKMFLESKLFFVALAKRTE